MKVLIFSRGALVLMILDDLQLLELLIPAVPSDSRGVATCMSGTIFLVEGTLVKELMKKGMDMDYPQTDGEHSLSADCGFRLEDGLALVRSPLADCPSIFLSRTTLSRGL